MRSLRTAAPTLAAAVLLTGAAVAAPDPQVLGLWKIEQARAAPLPHKLNARIDFRPDGQMLAHGGCNSITGRYTLEGNTLKLGALAVTRKICPDELMEQEDRVISALERAVHARVPPHGLLELKDELGTVMLRGSRVDAAPAQ